MNRTSLCQTMQHRYRAIVAAFLYLFLGCGICQSAFGHAPEQSYLFLRIVDDSIDVRFEATVADLNQGLGINLPGDGKATAADVSDNLDTLVSYLRAHLALAPNGTPSQFEVIGHAVQSVSWGQFVTVNLRITPPAQPVTFIDVDYNILLDELSNHRGLLVIEDNWKSGTFDNESQVSLVFSPATRNQRLDLSQSSTWRGFRAFVQLGIHHIWIGIDHILFLVALILPSVVRRTDDGWQAVNHAKSAIFELVKIVTLFTIAHSITLALAALGLIQLPARWVESVIALSIAIAAVNILYPLFWRNVGWVVFGFGLFHGLGFASVLAEIGIPANYVPLTLFGFNIGVELGQLAVVCLVFPLLYVLRATAIYRTAALALAPSLLILVSMYWFVERAFEIDLPGGAIVNSLVAVIT